MENWKTITYKGLSIMVSDLGNFINQENGKNINKYLNRCGYLSIIIKKKTISAHRLVAIAFISNPNNKPTVNHINGVKTDNRVENLEWNTYSENNTHSLRVLKNKHGRKDKYGKKHWESKKIAQFDSKGSIINEFYGAGEAFRNTGINKHNIRSVCNGLRKTAGGFIWKYV